MTNVIDLFPNATDEEYEDHILPILVTVLNQIKGAASSKNYKEVDEVAVSLLDYALRSMMFLDECRKLGMFRENRIPDVLSSSIDNLAADSALALGGEGAEDVARGLRNRTPTKRNKT